MSGIICHWKKALCRLTMIVVSEATSVLRLDDGEHSSVDGAAWRSWPLWVLVLDQMEAVRFQSLDSGWCCYTVLSFSPWCPLEEGEWAAHLHDSHFDRELGTKAATLPASKVSGRSWFESGLQSVRVSFLSISNPLLDCNSIAIRDLMSYRWNVPSSLI